MKGNKLDISDLKLFRHTLSIWNIQHNEKNKEKNTIIYKALHSKLQIEKHEPMKNKRG
jgi:hypothetical protein